LIEQGLTSPPIQYRLSGRQSYWSKDPTKSTNSGNAVNNSITNRSSHSTTHSARLAVEALPASLLHTICERRGKS